mmetsp:Transcript_472/g.906  ORF Transcript_472/g.906 Transcript_472/m.906 type:complete len:482 (+) Transcript_472:184-1629(+)
MARSDHDDSDSSPDPMTSPLRYKESGNKFIAMKKYSAAMACYRRGLDELPDRGADEKEIQKVEIALRSNLALALLKLVHNPEEDPTLDDKNQRQKYCIECEKECSIALALDESNSKVLYRRGQARHILAAKCGQSYSDRWFKAEEDFSQCVKLLQGLLKQQKKDGSSGKVTKTTTQQLNDAKRMLKQLNDQRTLIPDRTSDDTPQTLPKSDTNKLSHPFPWDVPTLLKRCPKPEPIPLGGCIVRGALNDTEQQWLYETLYGSINIHDNSVEMHGLRMTRSEADHHKLNPDNRPQPFVTWIHPYTRESNARERPKRLLQWAQELMHALAPPSQSHVVDSMLAQLYAPGGNLLRHRDEDLSWGIGVSLGSAANFDCLPENGKSERIVIRSGDVVVGEFGKLPHAVTVPVENNEPPAWWKKVDRFGSKRRCNVLFRQALSKERQRRLAEERAQKVYGMSLDALKAKTGKDDGYLSVHLRHLALE